MTKTLAHPDYPAFLLAQAVRELVASIPWGHHVFMLGKALKHDEELNVSALLSIQKKVIEFRNERDWAQFHDPKNLAEALSIEAGELLENFLWAGQEGDVGSYCA